MEELLAAYVAQQQQAWLTRQQQADATSMDWNAVHATVGSFADEHRTLKWLSSTYTATRCTEEVDPLCGGHLIVPI